jgi:Zn-finger nucleic acid-binding protein
MVYEGSRFCPHCGAVLSRAITETVTDLLCPKCEVGMSGLRLAATDLYECGQCHGLWVDSETLQQIASDREQQSLILGTATIASSPGQRNLETKYRYVPCPLCRELMHRVNFAGSSGVVVDVCKQHGTWFDRDELQSIIEFIRAGGMERAREKQKAELEQERRRLEQLRNELARSPDGGDFSYGTHPSATLDVLGWAESILDLW